MNLITSCFDCNRGKGNVNLSAIITGEDPHDKAIELAERERQLKEYEIVRMEIETRVDEDYEWIDIQIHPNKFMKTAIRNCLYNTSRFDVLEAAKIADSKRGRSAGWTAYFYGILKNWKHANGDRTKYSEKEN